MTPNSSTTTLGILFMLGFCAVAPVMDGLAKLTPAEVPVAQIVAARFIFQVLALYPMLLLSGAALGMHWRDMGQHMLRALALLLATLCFFNAIRFMPIADAIAIFFVEPFILTLMGAVFLKEPIGWRRMAASVVGFGGALLVIRPSFADLGLVAALPLGTAFLFAIYMLLTRAMSQRVAPLTLQAHTALAASLILLPLLILFQGRGIPALDPVWPSPTAVWTLLGVGVFATISHILLTFSLRFAPAGTIAPLQYFEIIGATAVGYAFFGDFPTGLTWLGIAIIVGSGLYIFWRERQAELRAKAPLPPA